LQHALHTGIGVSLAATTWQDCSSDVRMLWSSLSLNMDDQHEQMLKRR
jgi:hypothetical protein